MPCLYGVTMVIAFPRASFTMNMAVNDRQTAIELTAISLNRMAIYNPHEGMMSAETYGDTKKHAPRIHLEST